MIQSIPSKRTLMENCPFSFFTVFLLFFPSVLNLFPAFTSSRGLSAPLIGCMHRQTHRSEVSEPLKSFGYRWWQLTCCSQLCGHHKRCLAHTQYLCDLCGEKYWEDQEEKTDLFCISCSCFRPRISKWLPWNLPAHRKYEIRAKQRTSDLYKNNVFFVFQHLK